MIKLPTSGHEVTLKEWFTHGMETLYKDTLTKGVGLGTENGATVVNTVQGGCLDRAAEAVLMQMIEKVTKDNMDVAFGQQWFSDLPESDFTLLRLHVERVRSANEEKKAAGKKNN